MRYTLISLFFSLFFHGGLLAQLDCTPTAAPFCIGQESVLIGSDACVPVVANNFNDITGFQFALEFDASIVSYVGIQSPTAELPAELLEMAVNDDLAPTGTLLVAAFTSEGITVLDGTTLFELCFIAIGSGESPLTIGDTLVGEAIYLTDLTETPLAAANGLIVVNLCEDVNVDTTVIICAGQAFPFNGGLLTAAGDYEATFVTEEGCDSTVLLTLQIESVDFDLPELFEVCPDEQALVSVPDGFQLGFPGGPYGSFINLSAGQYTLEVVSENGCTNQQSVTVREFIPLAVSIEGEEGVCTGFTTTLTALPAGQTYQWSTESDEDSIEVGPGLYSVTVTDENGCTSETSITVIELPTPSLEVTGDLTYCAETEGAVLTAISDGVAPLSFVWSTEATSATVTLLAGTYGVTVTDGNGCTASTTVTVEELPTPSLEVTGDLTYCAETEGAVLTAISDGVAPLSFVWSTEATSATVTLVAGTYGVTVTDGNGCTASTTVTVEELPTPSLEVTGDLNYCAETEGAVLTAISDGVAPLSFVWSTEATSATVTLVAGTYGVTVTDGNGCTASTTVTVEELPTPSLEVTGDLNYCAETEGAVLTAISDGVAPLSFVWSTEATSATVTLVAGTYGVTVTDGNGCTASATVTVEELPTPSLEVTGDLTYCAETEGAVLTAISDGVAPLSFVWSTEATSATVTLVAGTYGVTVTDGNGCTASATVTVEELPTPISSISGETQLCGPEGNVLTASGGVNYLWSTEEVTVSINVTEPGVYSVTVTNEEGCSSVASITVEADTEAPEFVFCPFNQVLTANFGETGRIATWAEPLVTDNCGDVLLELSAASGDFFPLGNNPVTVTATDGLGNVNTCEFVISVVPSADLTFYLDTTDYVFQNDTFCANVRTLAYDGVVGFSYTLVLPEGSFVSITPNEVFAQDNGESGFVLEDYNNGSFGIQFANPSGTGFDLEDGELIFSLKLFLQGEPEECFPVGFSRDPVVIEALQEVLGEVEPTVIGGELCIPQPIDITGRVYRPDDLQTPVNKTHLTLVAQDGLQLDTTNQAGLYAFNELPAGQDFELIPERDTNARNGVTILDQLMILRHIQGVTLLDNPYQWVAADVTNNTVINGTDLTQIRQITLTAITEFPQVPSWRFIPTSFTFPNPDLPLTALFPETEMLNGVTMDTVVDFYGIKMGDVNYTADVNALTDDDEPGLVQLTGPATFRAGEEVRITVSLGSELAGLQHAMTFDPGTLQFAGVEKQRTAHNLIVDVNEANAGKGVLFTVIHPHHDSDLKMLPSQSGLYQLVFKALRPGKLEETLQLDQKRTGFLNIGANEFIKPIRLKLVYPVRKEGDFNVAKSFDESRTQTARWVSVAPNPFNERVLFKFIAPPQTHCFYEVYQLSGQKVLNGTLHTDETGNGQLELNSQQLLAKGTYFLRLQTGKQSLTHSFIYH